ncbi:MAG: hypothetical protein ACRER8_09995 [Pseudomonas sp.]|uniref:hypothetical protein n=1 Tax=Pseudomonas sp. TaxID=306 RepID=UPI003D6F6E74
MKILSASEKLTRGKANARTNGMPREPRIYYRKPFNRQVATGAAVAPRNRLRFASFSDALPTRPKNPFKNNDYATTTLL